MTEDQENGLKEVGYSSELTMTRDLADMTLLDYALPIAVIIVVWRIYSFRRGKDLPLPPGPPGLPFIGNIQDIPKHEPWLTYKRWSQEYHSDIIYLNLGGTSVIVVNSAKAAHDLFDKRSSLYSDRPRYPMARELIGWDWHFGFMPYGDDWRERRRIFNQHLNSNVVPKYRPRFLQCAREATLRILDNPHDSVLDHLRLQAGSVILNVVYGMDIQDGSDPYLALAETALHSMAMAGNMGSYLVDSFPLLKYIPGWLPFANFKRQALEWRKHVLGMRDVPFEAVKKTMMNGTIRPSIAATLLSGLDSASEVDARQEEVISQVSAAAYTGGADTSVSSLGTFFLAMLLHPEVLQKGQEEIDRVVGTDRLPDFPDQPALPYVTAIVKEVLRWKLVLPLSVPHRLISDDTYNGFHLPAGSIVVGNAWAVLHDEDVYPDPDTFKPERFLTVDRKLNPDIPDVDSAFGFGRRICPGRYLASESSWITVATVLSTLDITKPLDNKGRPVVPSVEFTDGMLCYPTPFQYSVKPRSHAAEVLLRASVEELI